MAASVRGCALTPYLACVLSDLTGTGTEQRAAKEDKGGGDGGADDET